jgi:hypothetical protein
MNKLVKLSELFEPKYGVNLELVNLDQCNSTERGAVPFVSRTEKNNGVSAFVYEMPNIDTNPAHTLSVAVSGSVLSTFYQPISYYSGRDLYVLIPKKDFSPIEMLFYAKYISSNKYRYNYGRQANKTLKDIMIPAKPDENLIDKLSEYKTYIENEIRQNIYLNYKITFNKLVFSELVKVSDLFDIQYGNSLELINLEQCKISDLGAIPFVSRTEKNNGISAFVYENFEIEPNPAHTLSVAVSGSVLSTFYQPMPYYTGFHVLILLPKTKMSTTKMLYYSKLISANKYKYNFGRQANRTLKNILIPKLEIE